MTLPLDDILIKIYELWIKKPFPLGKGLTVYNCILILSIYIESF